jgi:pimeloyl-ACP methyl ester carboxylesterase
MTRARILGAVCMALVAAIVAFVAYNWAPDRPVEELTARWAAPPSQFIDIAGLRVHVRDEGPRDDPRPIVLLHGTSSSLHTWNGWASGLRDRHRVIRLDLPGFGLTGPVPDGDYSMPRYVAFMRAVLDHYGLQHCTLAGNSFGGWIAWETALAEPNRIDRLVLVDAAGYELQSESVPIGFRVARIPVVNRLVEVLLPRSMVESSLRNVYGHPERVSRELVDRYFDLTTRAGNRKALAQRFSQARPGADAGRIRELHLPTLILWGGRDHLIPDRYAQKFATDIRGSWLVLFDDLGHVPQEEDPARTLAALQRFLSEH